MPIDDELEQAIIEHLEQLKTRWPHGVSILFQRPRNNLDGRLPMDGSAYRRALQRWLASCAIQDEHGQRIRITPHQWRHTLGTQLINRDVPPQVVRRILDHDSHVMTARYARLSDTTIRRHWEAARKVRITGAPVTLDPDGPLAEAAWAKQRVGRATQALPNGYCSLPLVKTCPHANALASSPRSKPITTKHRRERRMRADNTWHLVSTARHRHELARSKAIRAIRELDAAGAAVTFQTVAVAAEVSRSWLYSQPDIRDEVQRLRELNRRAPATSLPAHHRSSDSSLVRRLELANARNRELTEENQRLRQQLVQALGQLRHAGIRCGSETAEPPPIRSRHRNSITIGPC